MNKGIFLLIVCVTFYSLAKAQILELDTVIVSGKSYLQKLKESGRNISIITKEDIKQLPASTIDELLRYIPGIEVQQRGPQGSQSDIIIRGGTFQQVLIIVDGIRFNEPLTGHFNLNIPIQVSEIEKIEVIKGAAAAIYGPDAVGGVISISTKTFFNNQTDTKKELAATVMAGQYSLLNHTIRAATKYKKSYVAAGYQVNKADGIQLRGTTGFFDNKSANISFSSILNKNWKIMLRVAANETYFNAQNFYTTFISDTAKEKVNSSFQQFTAIRKSDKSTLSIFACAKQVKDIYTYRPSVTPNENNTSSFYVDIRNVMKLKWQGASLTTGIQFTSQNILSNDRGNHEHIHSGFYSVLHHQLIKKVFATESVRLDWDKSYKWVLVPQINIAYVRKNITWRASIGKGIRDADFTERYNNYNKVLVTSGSIGNPFLIAEESLNMEVGTDIFTKKSIQLHATLFQRNQQNLIDWVVTPYADMPIKTNLMPTGTYALATNLKSIYTRGAEIDINGVQKIKNNTFINWSTGFTFLESLSKNNTPPSFYISSHAKIIWNMNVRIYNKIGFISFSGIYKNRNELTASAINTKLTKEFYVLNFRAEKYILNKKISLIVQIDNIFDKSYSDLLGAQMPGRWIQGGFSLNLEK